MEKIRAFIAIQLPPEVRSALNVHSQALAAQVPLGSVRWVKPEALHLTLAFLGDTAVSLLPQVQAEMDRASARLVPFALLVSGFGCFPNCRRPRVLWAGISGDVAAARALKAQLDDGLARLGWPTEEREFTPHLTLGRVKDGRLLHDQRWPETLPAYAVPVNRIHLMQSVLRPEGPRYSVRHTSYLGTASI